MHRRHFVAAAAAGIGAGTLAVPAVSQGVRELRMITTWPRTLPGLQTSAERAAETINALSGGRLRVSVFSAGEIVPAFDSFDAVSAGVVDMYHSSEITWHTKSPAFSYFCNVPFGLTPPELAAWVRFGGGQELWDELSAGFGLKTMLCGTTGPQMGGWFNKELNSVDSFKGLKYRMPGPGGEVLRRLGAVVVNLPAGGIIDALRSGALDASEFATPWADMALGLHKAAKYYYYPGFHEPGAGLSLAVNKKAWDGMTAHERLVIETAAMAENDRSLAEVVANNAVALGMLLKEPSIDVRKLDDEILQALGKVSGEVLEETSAKDPLARRIHESFIKFRTSVIPWSNVSERSYLNARSLKYNYGRG